MKLTFALGMTARRMSKVSYGFILVLYFQALRCVFPVAQGRNVGIKIESKKTSFPVERAKKQCNLDKPEKNAENMDHLSPECRIEKYGLHYENTLPYLKQD
jgi:hypothetical protein